MISTPQTPSNTIKVCVRCRPFIANELVDGPNKEPSFYIIPESNAIEIANYDQTKIKAIPFGK